jgi:hypothetical protein
MRTSTGLTVTAVGAILLLAVHIPVPWLSLKIAGLIIMATGLAGLRIPQEVGGWLRHNQDRVMETFDPVSDADDTPRVPLDSLLDPSAAPGSVPWAGPGSVPSAGPGSVPSAGLGSVPSAGPGSVPSAGLGSVPSAGLGSVPSAGPGSVPAARPGPVPRAGGETLPGATEGGARRSSR